MKEFFRTKTKRTKSAIVASLVVVAIFGVMQAMETRSATTDTVNLSVEVASALDISCPDPAAITTLIAGTPQNTDATCTVTTNAASGYVLQVKQDATPTLSSGGNTITDLTAWNSGTPNSAVWVSGTTTGLGFRVMQTGTDEGYSTTWWGANDTEGTALYAGLPAAYVTILNDTTYSASATDAIVRFRVDVPASQATGTYTGTATFQGTVNP